MKKSRMTITILSCIGFFLIAALILVPAAQAGKVTRKIRITSYITKVEVVPVTDVEKHVVGVYDRRGVAVFENGETAAYLARGTADLIKGQGPFDGYGLRTHEDGSTTITEFQGTLTLPPGKKLRSFKGEGKYIKGTGRFEGIKGKHSYSGKYVTPYTKDKTKGDTYYEVTGTYTLPKK